MKIDYLLNREKAKNIVLFKVSDTSSENENLLEIVISIFKKAEVDIEKKDISDVRRLGKKEGNRPILISFENEKDKFEIFKKARNFGNMGLGFSNDMKKELREKKRAIILDSVKQNLFWRKKERLLLLKEPKF